MSNSALVKHTNISPNKTSPRNNSIQKITIHHMAGNLSVESCGQVFQNSSAGASSNNGVGTDGRVGMKVGIKIILAIYVSRQSCGRNISQLCLDQIQTGGKIN